MGPEELLRYYESALAAQDGGSLSSFIHLNACITFSTGQTHIRKEAFQ
jgi:hypothetical protein